MDNSSKPCVLVVDDQDFIRTLITMRLEEKDYRVLQAKDGEEAYLVTTDQHPDAIICDILMPGGDGTAFCRRLRAEGNKTPFLFLTAKGHAENVVEGLAFGADDYLAKPFDIFDLEARVTALLERRATPPPET